MKLRKMNTWDKKEKKEGKDHMISATQRLNVYNRLPSI